MTQSMDDSEARKGSRVERTLMRFLEWTEDGILYAISAVLIVAMVAVTTGPRGTATPTFAPAGK